MTATLNIIEALTKGKNGPENNEDNYVVSGSFAAVIDGATPKTITTFEGKKLGRIFAETMSAAVPELDPEMNFQETNDFLNSKIRDKYRQYGVEETAHSNPNERITGVMALYNAKQNAVMLFGECQVAAGDRYYYPKKIVDDLNASARTRLLKQHLAENKLTLEQLAMMVVDDEPGRAFILQANEEKDGIPGLRGQAGYQNKPGHKWSYYAVDGFGDITLPGCQLIELDDNVGDVTLMTDGYFLGEGNDPLVVFKDLQSAEENLKEIVTRDPFAIFLTPGTKGCGPIKPGAGVAYPDDRTYLKVRRSIA